MICAYFIEPGLYALPLLLAVLFYVFVLNAVNGVALPALISDIVGYGHMRTGEEKHR
jgi:Na+/melibiose symporter-like transporter